MWEYFITQNNETQTENPFNNKIIYFCVCVYFFKECDLNIWLKNLFWDNFLKKLKPLG